MSDKPIDAEFVVDATPVQDLGHKCQCPHDCSQWISQSKRYCDECTRICVSAAIRAHRAHVAGKSIERAKVSGAHVVDGIKAAGRTLDTAMDLYSTITGKGRRRRR